MTKVKYLILIFTFILLVSCASGLAQTNYSQGRHLGFGVQYMTNFPDDGHNVGFALDFWLMDFLGAEIGFYPLPWPPSYAIEMLMKPVNTAWVDLFFGAGFGFLPSDYRLILGMEITPTGYFAMNGQLGYSFLPSSGSVTAGVGFRFYI